MARTPWLDQVVAHVKKTDGWRVEENSKGWATAYAPDGTSIIQLKDVDADFRWRRKTLSDLRKAGLDLTAEMKGVRNQTKARKKAAAAKRPVMAGPAPEPQRIPAPADIQPRPEWRISVHAREQSEERNVPLEEVWAAVTEPHYTVPSKYDDTATVFKRGNLTVVVNHETNTIVTVAPQTPGDRYEDPDLDEVPETIVVKTAPIFEPPDEAKAFARSLSDEYLLCREIGHQMRPWQAFYDEETRRFETALKCGRCKTQKWRVLTSTGAVVSVKYVHPEGYLHTGKGRIVGTGRDSLRLESVMRLVGGNMRGTDKSRT